MSNDQGTRELSRTTQRGIDPETDCVPADEVEPADLPDGMYVVRTDSTPTRVVDVADDVADASELRRELLDASEDDLDLVTASRRHTAWSVASDHPVDVEVVASILRRGDDD
jgi:hypothetical protein